MRGNKLLLIAVATLVVMCLISFQAPVKFALAADKPAAELTAGGGAKGGVGFVVLEALSKLVKKDYPNLNINVVEGGWVGNLAKVDKGEMNLASTTVAMCALAADQKPPFTTPLPNVQAVYTTQDKLYYFALVRKDLPLNAVSDLVKKKPAIKLQTIKKGTATELTWRYIFESLGAKWEDLPSWGASITFIDWKEAVEKVKSGELDGLLVVGVKKIDWADEVCKALDMKILKWDKDLIDLTQQKLGFGKGVIPMGTYRGTNYDVIAPTDTGEIIANANVAEDVIYAIVKTLGEKADEYSKMHPGLEDFKAEGMPNVRLSLHPGAARYYKEKGYIK